MPSVLEATLPALPAVLTHEQAPRWLADAERALASLPVGATAVVSAAALQGFDSSALAALLALRRGALRRGLGWRVADMPPKLRTLAEVYGVAELLPG
ncbi:STAS domain-containing protein [Tepidimonas ignava]|uniref:STAS domain-containing protein n=1 Tax=Tepidimonas ignava TaxID=114249 RepID=UPI001048A948|nr:STAS domain-containing protein [Tepidimonas ignava]